MLMRIKNKAEYMIARFKGDLAFIKYCRSLGVGIGDKTRLYSSNFGSEPYLVSIGSNCLVSVNVQFITHDGSVNVIRNLTNNHDIDVFGEIKIGNNCFIGANVTILPGVTIGDNVIIAAGCVVNCSIPSGIIVAGVPAKYIGSVDNFSRKIMANTMPTRFLASKEKRAYIEANRSLLVHRKNMIIPE